MIFNRFSYGEYKLIIAHLRRVNTIMDYSEVTELTRSFCVIRHDVEFSVDRALELARYEAHQLRLNTSYLFQIRNNCYNLASNVNLEKIHQIKELGHNVGLHLHVGLKQNNQCYIEYILKEAELFEAMTGIKVDRFSYHRPPQAVLKRYLEVPGLIDCYGKLFFHYYDERPKKLNVTYYTDSRHKWQHGYPLNSREAKVQLLMHPYSWTPQGYENLENYKSLLSEKYLEVRRSINRETSTFPKTLLQDDEHQLSDYLDIENIIPFDKIKNKP